MSHLMDKVSYLRGLMEGMKLDTASSEGMLLGKVIDVLESMAAEITDVEDAHEELCGYVNLIDENLTELEDELDGELDDEDDDFDFDLDEDEDEDDEEDLDEDEDEDDFSYDGEILVECRCPECGGSLYVKESELEDDLFHICPRCDARIHAEPDYEEEDIPVASLAEDEGEDE